MNAATVLLLCSIAPQQSAGLDNLDFASGKLTGWEGEGFYITTASGVGPGLRFGVCSSDNGMPGRTGTLKRTITAPAEGGILRCTAFAKRTDELPGDAKLDIVVLGPEHRPVPKRVLLGRGWSPTACVLAANKQRPHEYYWDLTPYRGREVEVVLKDEETKPGCHLFCSGFQLVPTEEFEGRQFGTYMVGLAKQHNLAPMARFNTKHFMALSNADDKFSERRLIECEMLYSAFFNHFRGKGFDIEKPAGKMMAAIFDDQEGFNAYLEQKLSNTITGLYDRRSNRLVVYDFSQNSAFRAQKKAGQDATRGVGSDLDHQRAVDTINRRAKDITADANTATIVHEVAHQLSFNCGMLNRDGDVPAWIAEGLACYCESTENGVWLGVGEPNQERLKALAIAVQAQNGLLNFRDLIETDTWMNDQGNAQVIFLGYGQSWAMFRMLMEQRPKALRTYMDLIRSRRTPENRLEDFRRAFGTDLEKLEAQHVEYVRRLVKENYKPRK
jgi:hypothetical protein